MDFTTCRSLPELWKAVDAIHDSNFPENKLRPILGNGRVENPDFMFVFINPTARNISSSAEWKGPRFPFIGTKPIWRIFNRAGLFDGELMQYIEKEPNWSLDFTEKVKDFLSGQSFYFTNIVKWTGHDAALPDAAKVNLFLPILQKEIEIVKPKNIVTFGLIPFERLTNQKIRLKDYYEKALQSDRLPTYDLRIPSSHSRVIPCYFPVGRGDPKRAVELLKRLRMNS